MRQTRTLYDADGVALLTVSDTARYLSVSRRTVERLIARGDLVPFRVGTRRRLRIEDIDSFLERNREIPKGLGGEQT